MYKTQCVLALAALYVGLAQSWDIAVSLGDELIFYENGTKTNTVNLIFHNLTALAYDEVHNMMLYVDKQSEYDGICGYNLHSKENKCFIKRNSSNIHSIAFDPATDTLFFTDTKERSINWISLKPGSNNNVDGNLLIKMDDRTPRDIAVDSCRGNIYWTNTNIWKPEHIERARFNGSEREAIYDYETFEVFALAVDHQTRKIYYFDGQAGAPYHEPEYLNSNNWNGLYEDHITKLAKHLSLSKVLTVSKDYFYWMNGSESYKTVWQLPKNALKDVEPKGISEFFSVTPLGIAANYKIKDQIQGLPDCEVLRSLITKLAVTNNSLNIQQTTETEQPTEYTAIDQLFCVHGIKVSETSVCKCTPGYIGERCDVSVCENYCLQGDCSFNDEGLPKCRCNAGYSGERCEVYACHGYCLNNGDCSLNEEDEPVCNCSCKGDYVGDRCEVSGCLNYCIQGNCTFNDEGLPTCRCAAGYSGERCEVYACHGYCLNNGTCSLNEEDEPFCQCVDNHEGIRCETAINDTFTNTPFDFVKRNLTLADLLSSWRNPKFFLNLYKLKLH